MQIHISKSNEQVGIAFYLHLILKYLQLSITILTGQTQIKTNMKNAKMKLYVH